MILDSMARPIRMACIHRIGNTDIEMWCDEIAGPTYGFLIAWLYLYIDITMLSKNICMYLYIYVHISQSHHYPFIILSSFIIDPPPQKKKKKRKKRKVVHVACPLCLILDIKTRPRPIHMIYLWRLARCHAISTTESASPPSKSISIL